MRINGPNVENSLTVHVKDKYISRMKIKLKGKTDCGFDIIADGHGGGNFKIFHFENLEQDTSWYNDFYSDTLTVTFKPKDICFTGDICIYTKIM